ncbi:MAG: AMIN domain-containing protein, partial [Candidatus Muiribacteriaceae bacterium]
MSRKKIFLYIIITLSYIVFSSHEISSFKVWKTKDVGNYRVTLDLKGEPDFSTVNSGSERFIIINFKNTVYRNNSQSFRVKQKGIEYFKLAQFDRKNVRFVAKVSKNFQIKTFTLRTNSEFPYRVIIDLYEKNNNITAGNRSILPTVVIDPGHGGRDSGAVGGNNTYEK